MRCQALFRHAADVPQRGHVVRLSVVLRVNRARGQLYPAPRLPGTLWERHRRLPQRPCPLPAQRWHGLKLLKHERMRLTVLVTTDNRSQHGRVMGTKFRIKLSASIQECEKIQPHAHQEHPDQPRMPILDGVHGKIHSMWIIEHRLRAGLVMMDSPKVSSQSSIASFLRRHANLFHF